MNRNSGEGEGILLIHPPAAKACEAPGGPARLAGALRRHGIACRLWDANLEGQLALLAAAARSASGGSDAWTRRAAKHRPENLASLRSWGLYAKPDSYRRAVADLNRLVGEAAKPYGVRLSLADYEAGGLSPVRSADLLHAAAAPDANPFHLWFRERLPEVMAETPVSAVGFSLNYLSQALTAFAMIGLIRRAYPHLRIVLGGGLVTSWMRSPGWRNPFAGLVDCMIAGPGEAPLLALFGKSHDGGCDRPDLDRFSSGGLSGARCGPSLQRIERLLVAPLFLLPGGRRGEPVPSHPTAAGRGGPPRPDRAVPPGTDPSARQRPESRASPGPHLRSARGPLVRIHPDHAAACGPRFLQAVERFRLRHAEAGAGVGGPGGSRSPEQGDRSRHGGMRS